MPAASAASMSRISSPMQIVRWLRLLCDASKLPMALAERAAPQSKRVIRLAVGRALCSRMSLSEPDDGGLDADALWRVGSARLTLAAMSRWVAS
jgi:hypothetical protein